MARTYARIVVTRRSNADWRALPPIARYLYDELIADPAISHCGVVPYNPALLASLLAPMSPDETEATLDALEAARFIVLDRANFTIWVRTFIKHDGMLAHRNLARAALRAMEQICSPMIREACEGAYGVQLRVAAKETKADEPPADIDLAGEALATDPEPIAMPSGTRRDAIRNPSRTQPDGEGVVVGKGVGLVTEKQELEKPRAETKDGHPDARRLCERLADLITENGATRPIVGKRWYDAMRLLLTKDGYRLAEVEYVVDWCQRDEFWRTNILSAPTFREQYPKLRLKAEAAYRQQSRSNGNGAATQPRTTATRTLTMEELERLGAEADARLAAES